MLHMKDIRSEPEQYRKAMESRGAAADIDRLLELDEQRRALIGDIEQKKAQQNAASKQVPIYKKEGRDASELLAQMKALSEQVKVGEQQIREVDAQLEEMLLRLPNPPNARVPVGRDESDNVELRRVGEVITPDFEQKPHWEIGEALGILDPERAAKVTGARFNFSCGDGARLERALINYYLDCHGQSGYSELLPPFMVNRASMQGTGQLPKFEEDAFRLTNDYFMVPTAEVPVTNYYREEVIPGDALPISFCAYTPCFRAEAGSAGRDTRGLIRQHQFNKVELVKFTRPEASYEALEQLTADAEKVLQGLGLPYRVVQLCSGDLGFSSAMTYDIEVWMPSYQRYVEISSCSNFEAFQARRANIRLKDGVGDKPQFVHTLNGSGVAIGRSVAAILENFQQRDGSVLIPEVLRPYMGGQSRIEVRG